VRPCREFNVDLAEAMVFDVKMEGLVRKTRYVAGGHTTKLPQLLTYASVVTRDSVE
jgi:hypothetical protein